MLLVFPSSWLATERSIVCAPYCLIIIWVVTGPYSGAKRHRLGHEMLDRRGPKLNLPSNEGLSTGVSYRGNPKGDQESLNDHLTKRPSLQLQMLVIGEGLGKEIWLDRVHHRERLRFWMYTPCSASYMRGVRGLQGFANGAAVDILPLVLLVSGESGQACNMYQSSSSVTLDQQTRSQRRHDEKSYDDQTATD